MKDEGGIINPRISIDSEKIAIFCRKWKIVEFSLFGSVLTDEFRPDSDVDVMVRFEQPTLWTLRNLDQMEDELTEIFGRQADLSTKLGVEYMQNRIRRNSILQGARIIYAA
jgi:uncharacterized protein